MLLTATMCFATNVGCADDSDAAVESADAGAIGLNLEVAPGVDIAEVRYEITRAGFPPITGTIPLGGASEISFRIAGLPSGDGYTIRLSAVSSDGSATCSGEANFGVLAGMTTSVSVMLNCQLENDLGDAEINGRVNTCPQISALVVHPTIVNIFDDIGLNVSGSDPDGDPVTYAWNDFRGLIGTNSSEIYDCDVVGTHTITLTVSDGTCDVNREDRKSVV